MNDLERLAQRIVQLHLELPAIFILEAHKPLTTILHTATTFFQPLISPILGPQKTQKVLWLLADRKNIETLLSLIDQYSSNNNPSTQDTPLG